jgi:hypothetical protein
MANVKRTREGQRPGEAHDLPEPGAAPGPATIRAVLDDLRRRAVELGAAILALESIYDVPEAARMGGERHREDLARAVSDGIKSGREAGRKVVVEKKPAMPIAGCPVCGEDVERSRGPGGYMVFHRAPCGLPCYGANLDGAAARGEDMAEGKHSQKNCPRCAKGIRAAS